MDNCAANRRLADEADAALILVLAMLAAEGSASASACDAAAQCCVALELFLVDSPVHAARAVAAGVIEAVAHMLDKHKAR